MPPPPATITRGSNLRSSSSFPPRVAGGDANNQPPHHSRDVALGFDQRPAAAEAEEAAAFAADLVLPLPLATV
uniref:Uncharacterized protein n=1 Tax=Aegilops tauschii TaxID=37682 RepID=M8C294_AEGTA